MNHIELNLSRHLPELRVIHSIHLGFQADPESFPRYGGTDGYFRLFGEGGGRGIFEKYFR